MELSVVSPIEAPDLQNSRVVDFSTFVSSLDIRTQKAVLAAVERIGKVFRVNLAPFPGVSVTNIYPLTGLLRHEENRIYLDEKRFVDRKSDMEKAIVIAHEITHKATKLYLDLKEKEKPSGVDDNGNVSLRKQFDIAAKVILGEGVAELFGAYFVNQADETSAIKNNADELKFFIEFFLLSRCINYKAGSFEESISKILEFRDNVVKKGEYAVYERLMLDVVKMAKGENSDGARSEITTQTGFMIIGLAVGGYSHSEEIEKMSIEQFGLDSLDGDIILLAEGIKSINVDDLKIGLKVFWDASRKVMAERHNAEVVK